jgi:hypothetical protein
MPPLNNNDKYNVACAFDNKNNQRLQINKPHYTSMPIELQTSENSTESANPLNTDNLLDVIFIVPVPCNKSYYMHLYC